jgi:hypothetical protein
MAVITSASFKPLHCFAWSFFVVQIKVQLNLPVLGEGKKRSRPRLFRKAQSIGDDQ